MSLIDFHAAGTSGKQETMDYGRLSIRAWIHTKWPQKVNRGPSVPVPAPKARREGNPLEADDQNITMQCILTLDSPLALFRLNYNNNSNTKPNQTGVTIEEKTATFSLKRLKRVSLWTEWEWKNRYIQRHTTVIKHFTTCVSCRSGLRFKRCWDVKQATNQQTAV